MIFWDEQKSWKTLSLLSWIKIIILESIKKNYKLQKSLWNVEKYKKSLRIN